MSGQLVHCLDQRAVTDAGLFFNLAQSIAVNVMLDSYMYKQLVAVKTPWQNTRCPSPDDFFASGTALLLQTVQNFMHLDWVTVNYCAIFCALVFKTAVAVGANIPDLNPLNPVGFLLADTTAAMTFMARFASTSPLLEFFICICLHRHL